MTKLVRFNECLRVRSELNQTEIRETGQRLIAAIDDAARSSPQWHTTLAPLRDYAVLGFEGRIVHPRAWQDEPLAYEFREDQLPADVSLAYGEFTFWTHGLTEDTPVVRHIDGVAYVEVDE